ncbi:mating-type protein MAT-1 [Verticillium alfalfae VaMs.102]|uniref:Mating-type protein MAT-1 n=1 Tax=Verticillium alfalfae (strain VaMs.102 / ATCC MYA-4576 / FGSC 10136) TaxID=526221 RepID=C9SBZ2_VERA1|nr:mating-type protein MAT-1 [Verticillium alfalfae VaMs.102]EEY15876.1 mating-type protein MAT-1 [Verticillium alfalfae VaMs.102]
MSVRSNLLAYLATLPPQLLLESLTQQDITAMFQGRTMQQIAARNPTIDYNTQFQTVYGATFEPLVVPSAVNQAVEMTEPISPGNVKALRPLNAFMAFRFGKDNITVKGFLQYVGPVMKLVAPLDYLNTFKWTITVVNGERVLEQDQSLADIAIAEHQQLDVPNTELELLEEVLEAGFMPERASTLMRTMTGNAKGVMTTKARKRKLRNFIDTIQSDPVGAAASLLGDDSLISDQYSVEVYWSPEMSSINDSTVLQQAHDCEGSANTSSEMEEKKIVNQAEESTPDSDHFHGDGNFVDGNFVGNSYDMEAMHSFPIGECQQPHMIYDDNTHEARAFHVGPNFQYSILMNEPSIQEETDDRSLLEFLAVNKLS